jgi:hypothetical protein
MGVAMTHLDVVGGKGRSNWSMDMAAKATGGNWGRREAWWALWKPAVLAASLRWHSLFSKLKRILKLARVWSVTGLSRHCPQQKQKPQSF